MTPSQARVKVTTPDTIQVPRELLERLTRTLNNAVNALDTAVVITARIPDNEPRTCDYLGSASAAVLADLRAIAELLSPAQADTESSPTQPHPYNPS